jgi:Right handed beta helix region
MNYFDLYSSYPDHTITAAWDCQMTEATQTPWLKELLLRRGSELFPRFASCYAELRALPRNARRQMQSRIARSRELAEIFPERLQSGALQQKLARSLAGAALLMALAQGVATAATITVTTKDTRVRPDGQCSLIEAIVNANADAAVFSDCPAGDGADTIVLPAKANLGVRDVYDNTYGPHGLPLITSTITIQGNDGARIRRQASGVPFRLLAVSKTGNLTVQDVEVSRGISFDSGGDIFNNGILAIQNSTISGNSGTGGGILNQATLTIENSTISGNAVGVQNGGRGPSYAPSSVSSLKPGGVCFYYSYFYFYGYNSFVSCHYVYSGALTITNSTISKNSGVGIFNQSGTVTIADSDILGNKGGGAFNSGGAFDFYGKYIPAGDMSIGNNSTISKNFAQRGGGIFNGGILTIENTTISENKAADDGGGIFNASNNNAPVGDLSLLDTTISENRAKDSGGGMFNEGSLTMSDTVISNNRARFGPDVFP